MNLLKTDSAYVNKVMTSLLNESRVKRYLDAGMMTAEEIAKAKSEGNTSIEPCGKYVGGISGKDQNYEKFFDLAIGEKAHNLPDMVERRQKAKESKEAIRQKRIAELKAELNDLESQK